MSTSGFEGMTSKDAKLVSSLLTRTMGEHGLNWRDVSAGAGISMWCIDELINRNRLTGKMLGKLKAWSLSMPGKAGFIACPCCGNYVKKKEQQQ